MTNGAVFTDTIGSGFIFNANAGWISLGDGSPESGTNYGNASATDFGVNVDSLSDPDFFVLSGFGFSQNVGWINFDVSAQAVVGSLPRSPPAEPRNT